MGVGQRTNGVKIFGSAALFCESAIRLGRKQCIEL